MLKPLVDSVIERVPSRYSLVIGVAKRARQLVDAANAAKEPLEEKPVGVAVQEFLDGKFEIVDPPEEEETEPMFEEDAPAVEPTEAAASEPETQESPENTPDSAQ